MAEDKENFLERWSRVKTEQRRSQDDKSSLPETTESPERPPELPPIDKLTPDSEYAGFMHPKVSDALRRAALKKLFADPRFNVPDPFEAYSGDWTGGEPIPEEMLAKLNQARTLLFAAKDKKEGEPEPVADDPPKKDDEPGRQDA